MLASFIIVFREVIEAGLIVGIVLAATQGVQRRSWWIAGGVAVGVLGAALLATFAGAISSALLGNGQEVFNAGVLIVAALMLGWHNRWMASHGREVAGQMREMGLSVGAGDRSLLAMAVVVTVAVLREGSEVVLFLYGIAAASQDGALALLIGGLLATLAGCLLSWLLYKGLVAIPLKRLFAVTNWLLALLAAGMAGQAAAILAGADLIPALGYQVWDTSQLLNEHSMVGRAAHALVGYSDRPLGVQLLVYLLVLATLAVGGRLIGQTPRRRIVASQPQTPR